MNTATFMAIPLFAVYLSRQLGFSAAEVGTVMSANLLATRLLPSLGGALADRFGAHLLVVAGVWVRAAGLCGFLVFEGFLPLLLCASLVGVGAALYDPAVSGVFAAQPPAVRPRVFALHNLVLNLGVVVGPALGGAAALRSPQLPFFVSAIAFGALGCALIVLGRAFPAAVSASSFLAGYTRLLRNVEFVRFALVSVLWWVVYAQLFVSFPLRAAELGGDAAAASAVFLANGATGLVVIWGVMWLGSRVRPFRIIRGGYLVAALAMAAVPLLPELWWLLVCVCLYTVAETMMLPSMEIAVAEHTDAETNATYYGVFGASWAVGGSLGNYLGSWLILGGAQMAPWLVYGAAAVLGFLAMGCCAGSPKTR